MESGNSSNAYMWNPESSVLESGIQLKESGIQYRKSWIHSMESTISLHGAIVNAANTTMERQINN